MRTGDDDAADDGLHVSPRSAMSLLSDASESEVCNAMHGGVPFLSGSFGICD